MIEEAGRETTLVRTVRIAVSVVFLLLAAVGVVRLASGLADARWNEYGTAAAGQIWLALVVVVSLFNLLFWVGVPVLCGIVLLRARRWVRYVATAWAAICVLAAIANTWDAVAIAAAAVTAAILVWTPACGLGRRRAAALSRDFTSNGAT